jgi:PilZ domain
MIYPYALRRLAFGGTAYCKHRERETMHRSKHRPTSLLSVRTARHPRACVRRAVTVRVDYATADGRVWLGLVRNLSLQGLYIDSALRQVAHEVAPGNLLTVAFVLPSGRPCKLRAIVIHGDHRGCGVQFLEGSLPSLAYLASYLGSIEEGR